MQDKLTASDFERFWSKVDMTGDCWLWTGHVDPRGYGRFSVYRRSHSGLLASHLAYEMSRGMAPDNNVLHSCDNPTCVRPTHLRTGTAAENSLDMLIRRRNNSKLQPAQVLEIRQRIDSGENQRLLAIEFGVCQGNISAIAVRQTWRWLDMPLEANQSIPDPV